MQRSFPRQESTRPCKLDRRGLGCAGDQLRRRSQGCSNELTGHDLLADEFVRTPLRGNYHHALCLEARAPPQPSPKNAYRCESVSAVMISLRPAMVPVSVTASKNPADLLAVLTAATDSLCGLQAHVVFADSDDQSPIRRVLNGRRRSSRLSARFSLRASITSPPFFAKYACKASSLTVHAALDNL